MRFGRLWLAVAAAAITSPMAMAREAPTIAFETASGEPVSLAKFRGRPVLVDLWASWCAPCVVALPKLAKIERDYRRRGLVVVPLSLDKGGAPVAVRAYAYKKVKSLPLYVGDPQAAMSAFGARFIPATILFNADGKEVARFSSVRGWKEADLRRAIEAVLPPAKARN